MGIWGRSVASLGRYTSSSVYRANSSSPNSLSPSEALWSTPKQVPTINYVLIQCLWAIEKFRGSVTPSGDKRISTLAKEGAPVPEATMA